MDVLEEKIAPDKSGFVVTAISCIDDIFRIHHVHYFRSGDKVIVLAVSTPKEYKDRFDAVVSKVEQSFAF